MTESKDSGIVSVDPASYDRSFGVLIVALAVLLPVSVLSDWGKTTYSLGVCLVLSIGLFVLARRGARQVAALLTLLMLLALLCWESWRSDGLRNVAVVGLPAVVALASLLLPRLWFVAVTVLSLLSVTALMVLAETGLLVVGEIEHPSWGDFGALLLVLAAVALVVDAQASGLRRSIEAARENRGALEASERRFRALIENVSEVIAVLDGRGRIRYVSPAIEKVLGYEPAERQEIQAYDLVHPDDLERVKETFEGALREPGGSTQIELRMRHRDGGWRWIGLSGRNLLDDPQIRGIVLSYRDVTERREAEESVRASEEKFARTFNANPQAMGIYSRDTGRILDVNQSFVEAFGFSREEVVGRTAQEVGWAGDADRQRVRRLLETHGHVRNEEFELHTKDGERRYILLSVEAIDVGDEPCLVVASTDITERRRAEMILRESEQKFSRMFQANPGPMSISSAEDGRVIEVNEAMVEVTGWSREELIGHTAEEVETWEDWEERDRMLEELGRTGSVRPREVRVRSKDRGVLTWVLSAESVELGGERCILWSAQDVTENRRLADQLQRSQKMEAIGRLAGGVAHDFNNWLTPVVGYSELILATMDESDPQRSRVVEIHEAGKRAAELAGQLLRMGRGQAAEPVVLDLNEVVRGAQRLLQGLMGDDVELSTHLGSDAGHVLADRSQLEQVLLNLAVNARDAMPDGGRFEIETGSLASSGERAPGSPRLRPGTYALLVVSDTGEGMDASTRDKIFEPFFTTKDVDKGTGLGLATVYAIVQHMGGDISVYSEPGRGTTFKVYVPRAGDERPGDAEDPEEGAYLGTETVLLVEDQKAVREFAAAGLRRYGYEVVLAEDGEQALELIGQGTDFDVLVTDVVMPRLGGPELVARVRERRPGCRVVYVSGYSGRALVDRSRVDPGSQLLHKPFTAEDLARVVRQVLADG